MYLLVKHVSKRWKWHNRVKRLAKKFWLRRMSSFEGSRKKDPREIIVIPVAQVDTRNTVNCTRERGNCCILITLVRTKHWILVENEIACVGRKNRLQGISEARKLLSNEPGRRKVSFSNNLTRTLVAGSLLVYEDWKSDLPVCDLYESKTE